MKGDLCQKCRVGIVTTKKGIYCQNCLFVAKRTGLQSRPAFQGYWYDHTQGGMK